MEPGSVLRFEGVEIRPAERCLLIDGQPAALGARAFDLLLALAERRERVVGKDELLDLVWPGLVVEENNLQVHVSALRKLLGARAIATVPGRGYRFVLPAINSPPAAFPTPDAAVAVPRSDLIGREADLRALTALLGPGVLVTVVGAGGIGKTRLALALAAELRPALADAHVVELAALSDPALVGAAIAATLRLGVGGERDPLQAVSAALHERDVLLVIDNCEHLIDAAAQAVAALRAACPRLRLLATSQEALRVEGESVYRLDPLALGAAADAEPGDAVRLFLARAAQADARAKLDGPQALALAAAICRRLDGIPLAIELAAARVPLLGLQGLHDRLDARFHVLTGGARSVMRRHQTLRATLEWSHALLSADEQAVFRRLGVFAGGFSMTLAQAVLAEPPHDRWAALELLGHLVDKSLVVAQGSDEPRYHLLESTRAFALEQLAAAGETEALLRRHALGLLEELRASEQRAWTLSLAEIRQRRAELDNLRAALDWAAREDRALAAALFGNGWRIWASHALLAEAVQRALALQPLPEGVASADRAACDLGLARCGFNSGRIECLQAAMRAADGFAALGDDQRELEALDAWLVLAARRGDTATGDQVHARGSALVRPDTPRRLQASWLAGLGAWHRMADRSREGLECVQRQQALYREEGPEAEAGVWIAEANIAAFMVDLGEHAPAIERLEHARCELKRLGSRNVQGWIEEHLCRAWLALGDCERALQAARAGMPGALNEDNPRRMLRVLVLLHARRGDAERAARLSAFFERESERLHWAWRASDRAAHDAAVKGLRDRLGGAAFERCRVEGAALGLERAIALALAEDAPA